MDAVAEIAARYGAGVAPGVTVQRLPMGASARPYPVWDPAKNALVVPDWKEQEKARRAASVRRVRKAREKHQAKDRADLQKLRDMHAAGATTRAIAEACGISESYCRAMLSRQGLKANRDPAHVAAAIERRCAAGHRAYMAKIADRHAQIMKLAAEGATLAAIAQATGLKNGQHLRRLIAKLAPDHAARFTWPVKARPAPVLRGPLRAEVKADRIRALVAEGAGLERIAADLGMKPGKHLRRIIRAVVPDFGKGPDQHSDLAERDLMVARLYPDMSQGVLTERLGLTLGQVAASVKRARAAGLLPQSVKGQRIKRPRAKGLAYHADRNARILDLHRQGWTVEAIMVEVKVSRDRVKRILNAAGESVRNERQAAPARRLSELPELIAKGMTGPEIAARWGITLGTVYQMAHRAGISLTNRGNPHNFGAVSPKVAARRELVRGLFLQGMLQVDMLDLLKISHSTLSSDIKALGLSGQSPNAMANRKTAERQRRAA